MHLTPGQHEDLKKALDAQPEEKLQLQPASEEWANAHDLSLYLPPGLGWTGWFAVTNKIGWYYSEYMFWLGKTTVKVAVQVPHNVEMTELLKSMASVYGTLIQQSIMVQVSGSPTG